MNIGFCLPMDFEVCTHKISIGERERHPKKTRKLNNEYPTQEKKTTLLNVIKYIRVGVAAHGVCMCSYGANHTQQPTHKHGTPYRIKTDKTMNRTQIHTSKYPPTHTTVRAPKSEPQQQ